MSFADISCPWCSKAIGVAGMSAGSRVQCPRCRKTITLRPEDLHAAAVVAAPPPPRPVAEDPPAAPSFPWTTWLTIAGGAAAALLIVGAVVVSIVLGNRRTPQVAAAPPAPAAPLVADATPAPVRLPDPPGAPVKPPQDDPPPPPLRKAPRPADPLPLPAAPPELTPAPDPEPPPPADDAPPELRDKVNRAIDRGVAFLVKSQNGDGSWPFAGALGFTGESLVGPTCLAALTLLECGRTADEPAVAKAAAYVRRKAPNVHSSYETYELALAILFLDRLHDDKDEPLIQGLALRLIAGQKATGGWTYRSADVTPGVAPQLLTALRRTRPTAAIELVAAAPSGPEGPPAPKDDAGESAKAVNAVPAALQKVPALLPPRKDADFIATEDFSTSDNSNTQFALLGLWTARKHGVPVERALALSYQRFRLGQRAAGGWGYLFGIEAKGGVGAGAGWGYDAKPSMTAAGLLALAVGHGVTAELQGDAAPKEAAEDSAVEKGMKALSESIGADARPLGGPADGLGPHDLYFLWSVERVGVLYGRRTIGGKEWYPWGAAILVDLQKADGSWADDLSPTPVGTSFALLFLKRANVVRDLSTKLEFLTQARDRNAPSPGTVPKKDPGP